MVSAAAIDEVMSVSPLKSVLSRTHSLHYQNAVAFRTGHIVESKLIPTMRAFSKYLALLCLLLTLGSAVAVVAHHHLGANDSAKCTVCIAAHSARPSVTSRLTSVSVRAIAVVRIVTAPAQQRMVSFALYVRPPPQV